MYDSARISYRVPHPEGRTSPEAVSLEPSHLRGGCRCWIHCHLLLPPWRLVRTMFETSDLHHLNMGSGGTA